MKQQSKRKLYGFLPWALTLAVLAAFSLWFYDYYGGVFNPFEEQIRKANLLSAMRIHLLEAVEAEKNAVMAINDGESMTFAAKARQAADRVENGRKEIETVIHQAKFPLPREAEMMNEFNSCWSRYKPLNETVLDLAIQNTNLKAQRISATQGAQALEQFEESLKSLIQRSTRGSQCHKTAVLSYEALAAGLKTFALHQPHIEEADDPEMDKIEQLIKSNDEAARKNLVALRSVVSLSNDEDLKNAEIAYERFMNLTGEILKLSRMNTNIKSAALSLGKIRLISSQCQEILANFQKAAQNQVNYSLPRSKKRIE